MRHLPLYLLLENSNNMVGEPIESVKVGLGMLISMLRNDPYALDTIHLSFLTYSKDCQTCIPLTPLENFQIPLLQCTPFPEANLGKGLNTLYQKIQLEVRKNTPEQKGDWKPLVFILTTGSPTDLNVFRGAIPALKKLTGIVIGCAAGPTSRPEYLLEVADYVLSMDTLDQSTFTQFIQWLSRSVAKGTQSLGTNHGKLLNPQDFMKLPPAIQKIDPSGSRGNAVPSQTTAKVPVKPAGVSASPKQSPTTLPVLNPIKRWWNQTVFFDDLGSGITLDKRTQLRWTQKDDVRNDCSNNAWRLPSLKELLTLVDYTCSAPATKFQNFLKPKFHTKFNSNTLCSFNLEQHWAVDFKTGYNCLVENLQYHSCKNLYVQGENSQVQPPTSSLQTLATRLIPKLNTLMNFKTFGDLILDSETGLMWQRIPAPNSLTWKQAQEYCNSLSLEGFKDWRLPSIHELASLLDWSQSNPASSFPGMKALIYWTATPHVPALGYWVVDFEYGILNMDDEDKPYAVRCVRG
ncbi:MAG: DUF1566 domain-containing protein [SAR324 cluster bacterium]|nr:DUF1566 domain-containing protein [SAR324 cluster bacterium]